jgi:hypothetical protein
MSGIDTPNGRPKPNDERRDNQDLPSIQPVVQDSAENGGEDPISEIDDILEHWTDRQHQLAEREARAQAEAKRFLEEYKELSEHVIKPAMEQIIQRLRKDGGGGLTWEGGSTTTHRPRLVLWMSLDGEIIGAPRQDLNPYLQLDADVAHRRIDVWEGDMWQKQGTSRSTAPWQLNEISTKSVTERVVAILERAARHGEAF